MKTWMEKIKPYLLALIVASIAASSLTGCVVRDDDHWHDHDHDGEHHDWDHDHDHP